MFKCACCGQEKTGRPLYLKDVFGTKKVCVYCFTVKGLPHHIPYDNVQITNAIEDFDGPTDYI